MYSNPPSSVAVIPLCILVLSQDVLDPLEFALITGTGLDVPVNTSTYPDICRNAWGTLCMYCGMTVMDSLRDFRPRSL